MSKKILSKWTLCLSLSTKMHKNCLLIIGSLMDSVNNSQTFKAIKNQPTFLQNIPFYSMLVWGHNQKHFVKCITL